MREYSTERAVEQVMIDGHLYEVRELTVDGSKAYRRALGETMELRLVSTGKTTKDGRDVMRKEILVRDFEGAQTVLLCNTVFKMVEGKGTPVSSSTVGGWGNRMAEELARVASDLNGLDVTEEVQKANAEKN
jgi:hypothetical protein